MSARSGYSALQIGLHWLIAILIFAAYVTSDGMGRALRDRIESGASGTEGNTIHVWLGGAVFALVLVRIVVRAMQGAPALSEAGPAQLKTAAVWGHRLIYLLMIAVPTLGATAWYLGVKPAGEVHELAGNAFMLIVFGHAIMAIVHEAWLGDGTFQRMIRPGR